MANPATQESGKFKRGGEASASVSAEARDRLLQVEELHKAGRVAEAVEELLHVGQLYITHAVPVKAVAVLRQAVRFQPDSAPARLMYGDVLVQMRMQEDAAREYAAASQLFEATGQYDQWLLVMRRLLDLDPDNLHGRLQLAEALSRAGKNREAAEAFANLAEMLLQRDDIEDWERVAERVVYHEPGNTTVAHDLALHYVRSGRHAEALAKLIVCYEATPNDAEVLELIIDTLEALGQPDKAALLCRELVNNYKRIGLQIEVERVWQRLYSLDPTDPDAREALGVLHAEIQQGMVIELDSSAAPPPRRRPESQGQVAHPHFDPERTGPLPARRPTPGRTTDVSDVPVVPTRRPSVRMPAELANLSSAPVVVPPRSGATSGGNAAVVAGGSGGASVDWADGPTLRAPNGPTGNAPSSSKLRKTQMQALDALASSMHGQITEPEPPAEDEDEPGFDVEDRTIFQPSEFDEILLRGISPATVAAAPLTTTSPAVDEPVASARRRSNSLPRPRLARRMGTSSDLPSVARDMSKDLGTLDFFIERGFYDSAVALLDALAKRHPDHPELSHYREMIERMPRS